MSQRSVRTAYRKLREIEDAAVVELTELVADRAQVALAQFNLNPTAAWPFIAQDAVFGAINDGFRIAMVSLSRFTEENSFGIGRDVVGVLANLGVDAEPLDEWNPFGWQHGAEDAMERWRITASQEFGLEIARQDRLSRTVDEDYADGFQARILSDDPVRRDGRRGPGVLWSVITAHSLMFTTVAWQMVNEQRLDAIDKVQSVLDA